MMKRYTTSRIVGIAVSVLLLSGGICLLRRRRAGRSLHVAYGIVGVATTIINLIISIVFIFPSMFAVILGPMVPVLSEMFDSMIKNATLG